MSTTAEPAAAAPTDPRVGQLMDLAQELLTELGDVATAMAAHIPDEMTRRRLTGQVEKTVGSARSRYSRIALGEQR